MIEQTTESHIRKHELRHKRSSRTRIRRIGLLLGCAALGIVFSQGASSLRKAPASHGPGRENCDACHGPPLGANQSLFEPQAVGTGSVHGYASASSVRQGESLDFHVSATGGVATYDIHILRAGVDSFDYEPLMRITDLPGASYECGPVGAEPRQEDVDLGCDWPVAYTLQVPDDWPSGIYVAGLLDENSEHSWERHGSYIQFIVKEDRPGSTANIVFQSSTNTWQAYNYYEDWSFYTEPPARRITFDRPYRECMFIEPYWTTCRSRWEIPLATWLESEGYRVEYVANEDVHSDPTLLSNYRLFLSVGQDEYWSKELRDNIDAFIDAGGNVAIFSGNTSYRAVRYEDEGRTLVCYKFGDRLLDPLYGVDNAHVTSRFADDPLFWPENSTTGVGFRNGGWVNTSPGVDRVGRYTVYRSDHWVYEGTALQDGDQFWYEPERGIEVDGALYVWQNGLPVATGEDGTPASFTILGVQHSTEGHATMGTYSRDGGGTVFNAATMGWARGLWPQDNPDDYQIVRQITRNVIDTLSSGGAVLPLKVTKQADQDPARAGSQLRYTIRVTNTGDVDVHAIVTDTLPGHTVPGGILTWSPTIPPRDTWVETVDVAVNPDYAGPLTNTLQVTAEGATRRYAYTVNSEVPISGLAATNDGPPPLGLGATLSAAIAAGSNVSYAWDFGDGSGPLTTGETTVTHTYQAAGTYNAVVTASNGVSLETAATTVTITHSLHDLMVRVIGGLDDAEERPGGSLSTSSSDLELVYDSGNQSVGMRFDGVDIPQGATVVNAYVQFHVDETSSEETVLTIHGQDVDDAATFGPSSWNISSRAATAASVSWVPPAWTAVGAAGADQRTPDITSIIQEIISRPGWSSGNALVVVMTGSGKRTAESYDGDQDGAPLLYLQYGVIAGQPPANQAPSVEAGPDQTVFLTESAALDGTVSDDDLPDPPAAMTVTWSQVGGAGAVAFGDVSAIDTSATFSEAGTYVLRLTADDGEVTASDDVAVTVTSEPPANQTPSVEAGPDQTITVLESAALDGTVTDDGLPEPPAAVTTAWSQISGAALVTFTDASAEDASASFSAAGTYVLRLSADDGELVASDDVTVTVTSEPPANRAPSVEAGPDQDVTLPESAALDGTVTDDGLPDPPAAVTTTWSRVSGAGAVTFADASAVDTSASFSEAGTFVLRLAADDGELGTSDDVTITITSGPPENQAPGVEAGPDQDVTLPESAALDGTVTDDSLPDPPAAITTAWSQVSGAGVVTFADESALDTSVTFSEAGAYVLRLTAYDGELSTSDQMSVMVNDTLGEAITVEVRVTAGSDDAEESSSGNMYLVSSDLELVYDAGNQTVGMRFNGVELPQGATIDHAYVQFQVDETDTQATLVTIRGEDVDDAATFTYSDQNISSRPRTAASATWSPGAWTVLGEAGPDQRTPDIAGMIQEIVDRPGWASGNSLVVIITGSGERVAESYNGTSDGAPLLHVEYTTGPPVNRAPAVDAGPDQTISSSDVAYLDGAVTDDSLPASPGAVITLWSQTSGPGTVTFADASAVDTSASFSEPGTYELRLAADDGELTAGDDVIITVMPPGSQMTAVEARIAATSDDAEEWSSGSMLLTSSDLELVYDYGDQTVGLRFNGVDIPQRASIVNATIQFQVDEMNSGATSLVVEGQAADNPPTFSPSNGNISTRPKTNAAVSWDPPAWTSVGEAGPDQRTSDISPVIQEIVNRTGWSSGNSLVIIITGAGERVADSFDGDPAGAPLLQVEYTTGPPVNQPPTVDAGQDQTMSAPDTATLDGTVTDDGLPDPPATITTLWSQTSGPGTVTFADASAVDTAASFSEPGIYGLRLAAGDGELTTGDNVIITVMPPGAQVTAVEARVAATSDDAEEWASGSVLLTSSDLELVYDYGDQTVGVRFSGVDIPPGATIINATVQFQVDETSSTFISLTIEGQAADSPPTFASSNGNISSRARTNTVISWSPPAWTTVGEAGPDQRTPDIGSVIQEIVNRTGWSSGNSVVIIITGTGERVAESYDGVSSAAPLLHVEYVVP